VIRYFPARCSSAKCRRRRQLSKHPSEYARWPVCSCWRWDKKAKKWYHPRLELDQHRIAQRKKPVSKRTDSGPTCKCAALPGRDGQNMPHRAGSVPSCVRRGVPF
jgi:hypothetical protein